MTDATTAVDAGATIGAAARLELGLDTVGDVTHDADGRPRPHAQVLRDHDALLFGRPGVPRRPT